MAFRRKTRRTKRATRKPRVRRVRRARVGRHMTAVFPKTMRTKLTYAENISITSSLGVPYNYLFSVNGCYDPNITGTGTQPRYFDTLCGATNTAAPYYNYRVFGSKITIEAIATGGDSTACRGFMGIGLYNTTTSGPSSLFEMRARKDYKTKFIGYWSGGHDMCKISRNCKSVAPLFGIKDIKDDLNLAGDYSYNPATEARWAITYIPFDESTSRSVQVLVKIVYDVEFFNRNDVLNS